MRPPSETSFGSSRLPGPGPPSPGTESLGQRLTEAGDGDRQWTVQLQASGDLSAFPASSTARTRKTCDPFLSPL